MVLLAVDGASGVWVPGDSLDPRGVAKLVCAPGLILVSVFSFLSLRLLGGGVTFGVGIESPGITSPRRKIPITRDCLIDSLTAFGGSVSSVS